MNRYIKKLKDFLISQTPNFKYDDANSLFEVLLYYYLEDNPVDNAVIRCQYHELDDILSQLSLEKLDAVCTVTCGLCASYERQAFLDGIQVGMRLRQELDDLTEQGDTAGIKP